MTSESLPWPERQSDFEQERVLAAARRGLFDGILTAPTMIGRYRIERRVAAGGMGEVYLGFDVELQRSVAIKLVLPHLSIARGPERLRHEARALARLSHPNVVQVYEVGEHQGRTFLAMELIEGETLADWLAVGRRSWREILERFLAAGRGLAAAHAAGIIHRDFKPENVPMTREGRVCVADFGLAWTEESVPLRTTDEVSQPTSGERLSTTGAVLGTIRYMPLEQIRGERVDARADQFAFCVALYEALWSISPFPAESVDERRRALETSVANAPPWGRTPRGLWRVVRRGLSRVPTLRWPDMVALVAALEAVPRRRRWLAIGGLVVVVGNPLLATALPPVDTKVRPELCDESKDMLAGDWGQNQRMAVVEKIGATGRPFAKAIAATTVETLDSWHERRIAENQDLCEATMARLQPEEVLGVRSACLEHQRGSFVATVEALMAGDVKGVTKAFDLVVALPEPELCGDQQGLLLGLDLPSKEQAERVAELRGTLARSKVQRLLGYPAKARQLVEPVVAGAKSIGYEPLLAEALAEWGEVEFAMEQHLQAVEDLKDAFKIAHTRHHDRLAAQISFTLAHLGALEPLHEEFPSSAWLVVAEAAHQRVGSTPLDRSRLLFVRGNLAYLDGDFDNAKLAYETALILLYVAPELAALQWRPVYLAQLAMAVNALDGADAARPLFRRALAEAEAGYGPDHPAVAMHVFRLAQFLLRPSDPSPEGVALLERAKVLWTGGGDQAEPMLGRAALAEAQLAMRQNAMDLVQEHVDDAKRIFDRTLDPGSPTHADAASMAGYLAYLRGEYQAALDIYDRAIEQLSPHTGPANVKMLWLKASAGLVLLELHRWDEARTRFEAAVVSRRLGGHVALARYGLAVLDLHDSDPTGAARHLDMLDDMLWQPGHEVILELELMKAVAALRLGRRPMDLSPELRAALHDDEPMHPGGLHSLPARIGLTARERRLLDID